MLDVLRLATLVEDLHVLLTRWWGLLLLAAVTASVVAASLDQVSWVVPVVAGLVTYCAAQLPAARESRRDYERRKDAEDGRTLR